MIRKSLLMKIFEAFSILRWNDHVRPVELIEMDKHAHKMAIAFCLALAAEKEGQKVEWHNLIKGGVFELFRRSVISDIKRTVYYEIKKEPGIFKKLNEWVWRQLVDLIDEEDLKGDIKSFLDKGDKQYDDTTHAILSAAHILSSEIEFELIAKVSPYEEVIVKTRSEMAENKKSCDDVTMKYLGKYHENQAIKTFVDITGQLRLQKRWSQTPRVPMTSVLGHSMFVATAAYLITRTTQQTPCEARLKNNFFAGLFHDLPEALTRDIISPVKRSTTELDNYIKEIECAMLEKNLYEPLKQAYNILLSEKIKYLIQDEFKNKYKGIGKEEKISTEKITLLYNEDRFDPVDGEIVKIADELAAFMEANTSIKTGVDSPQLRNGMYHYREKYVNIKPEEPEETTFGGIKKSELGKLYLDFD